MAGLASLLLTQRVARGQSAEHPIDPDRPDVTNTASLVVPGFVQVEAGGLYTRASAGHSVSGSPVGFRIGLRDWVEARVSFDGVLHAVDSDDSQTGFGNIQLGAKLRVWPAADGQSLLSLLPAVNVPTASAEKGLGSGGADFTLAMLTAVELNPRSQVGINYIIGAIAADAGASHFVQHVASASLGVSVTDRWNPFFEVFVFSRTSADGSPAVGITTGTMYTIGHRLALDSGVQFGLTEAASSFAVFGGVSVAMEMAARHASHADRHLPHFSFTSASERSNPN